MRRVAAILALPQIGLGLIASGGLPEAAAANPPSRFQLGLGTGVMLGLGDVWERDDDVVGNWGSPVFLELSLAPSYRVASDFALGVRAAYGLEPGSRSEVSSSGESVSLERNMWQLGATGRYQPEPARAWYVGAHVGTAAVVDHRGDDSVSQWAPRVGAAVGYDLHVARLLSLGLELRASYAAFGEGTRTSPAGYYDYQVDAWLGCGVVGNILP